ncbi:MAG: hypothetical protein KH296_15660, partial [Ruminococcus sp.]|nr:hypothetical protein [Ruminococcus sp.]
YQEGLVPLLIQASPTHCLLLLAIEAGDLLDSVKEQEKCPDILQHEEIEEIYKSLLPGTQLNDEEKQEHIERIKRQYKKN